MNGRERIALAMQHKQPDPVPVMCQLALGHYFLHAGLPPHRIWFTSEGFAEALVRLQERYQFEGILVNLPGRPGDLLEQVASIDQSPEGERVRWRSGETTFIPWDDSPRHVTAGGAALPRADFASIDPERLHATALPAGYTWNIYHTPWLPGVDRFGQLAEPPPYFTRTLELLRTLTAGRVSIHGEVFSPFTHYMELFGYEQALTGLAADPGRAQALLDRLTVPAAAWAAGQARCGVDAVLISSAFAGASFISRRMYRQFVLPYERRVVEAVRACTPPTLSTLSTMSTSCPAVPVYTHTCGKIGDRLELLAETGTEGIDTLDPPPLGDVNLADAKRRIGSRLFIKGNLDPVALLGYTKREEVTAAVRTCLHDGSPGGGYILSTACSVAPRTDPWKLEMLASMARALAEGAACA